MRKSYMLLLVMVLADSTIITCFPVRATKTIVVPEDYPTIATAIGNATEGDTVIVRKGIYEEQQLIINETITLTGEKPENTKINVHPALIEETPP